MKISCKKLRGRLVQAIVLSAAIVSIPLASEAQTHYKGQISVGAHGGVDLSLVNFSPGVRQLMLPGANFGFNFRYSEEKHFGFIAEVNFMQMGWKENFDGHPFEYSRTVNFIQIPFMSHIYFGNRGRFFVNLGPSVSFKLGDKVKSNFDYMNVSGIKDFPVHTSQQYAYPTKCPVDFGITGGLGGEFAINPHNALYLEARYYFGLVNMISCGRQDHFKGANPMTLSISLGYWFRVK